MTSRETFMREALDLARRGAGRVEPNPMVGAVVVRDDTVVGRGYHAAYGRGHAEVEALRDAGENARGADVYVTLEPCSSHGKTPPCTEALIRAGVARVFPAVTDPDPRHVGAASSLLRAAGIEVISGVLEREASELLAPFARYCSGTQPFVLAKWASTLDGRIATRTGDSKWITGESARSRGHEERSIADAILVGVGTVVADDPALTTRHVDGPSPRRIIVDPNLRTPPDAAALRGEGGALVLTSEGGSSSASGRTLRDAGAELVEVPHGHDGLLDMAVAFATLRARGFGRLFVEGGGTTLGRLLRGRLVDRVQIHIAPRILAAADAVPALSGPSVDLMTDAIDLGELEVETAGHDLIVSGNLEKSSF